MCFLVSNYLNLFFRVSIESVRKEDGRVIVLNNTLEGLGNAFLSPIHKIAGGRKVTLLQKSYHEEKMHQDATHVVFGGGVYGFFLHITFIIIGISIKIFAWIFEKDAFARNKHLHQMQEKSLMEYRGWKLNNALCNSLNERISGTKESQEDVSLLLDLPVEINLLVLSFLEKKDLYNLSQTNAREYILTHDVMIVKKLDFSKKTFSAKFSAITEIFGKTMDLSKCPRMHLPAHRITDNPIDLRIQKYGSAEICDGVDFLNPEDLGSSTVKWGVTPIPFVAIRVKYTKNDDRFFLSLFTHLAFKLNLRNDLKIVREGVITLTKQNYDNSQEYTIGLNGSLRPFKWVVRYPWKDRSCEITGLFTDTLRDRTFLKKLFQRSVYQFDDVWVALHPKIEPVAST